MIDGPSQVQLAGLGLVVAFAIVRMLSRRDGSGWQEPMATLGLAGVAAIAAARGWSLLEWWWVDSEIPWIWDPLTPAGYSSAGAFFGAGAVLVAARSVFGRAHFAVILDVVAPAGFVALAFARLGCVFERCDPGRPTSLFLGVTYPDGAHLHPFGGYIALGTFLIVALTWRMRRAPGVRALAVVLGYSMVRFVAEFTRDAPAFLHFGHLVAVSAAAAAIAWWMADGREGASSC